MRFICNFFYDIKDYIYKKKMYLSLMNQSFFYDFTTYSTFVSLCLDAKYMATFYMWRVREIKKHCHMLHITHMFDHNGGSSYRTDHNTYMYLTAHHLYHRQSHSKYTFWTNKTTAIEWWECGCVYGFVMYVPSLSFFNLTTLLHTPSCLVLIVLIYLYSA